MVGARADVCQGKQCSLFYAKRFCMTCAAAHKPHFPPEIQKVRLGIHPVAGRLSRVADEPGIWVVLSDSGVGGSTVSPPPSRSCHQQLETRKNQKNMFFDHINNDVTCYSTRVLSLAAQLESPPNFLRLVVCTRSRVAAAVAALLGAGARSASCFVAKWSAVVMWAANRPSGSSSARLTAAAVEASLQLVCTPHSSHTLHATQASRAGCPRSTCA
jgi:hypothetical protein